MMGLLFLVLMALLAIRLHRRRRSLAISACMWPLAIVVLTAWLGLLPAALLHGLQECPARPPLDWRPGTTIIVLGVGTERFALDGAEHVVPAIFGYGRLAQTAALYRTCQEHTTGCRVLVSGGDTQGHGLTEAAVYSHSLERLGIPAAAQILEDRSRNTFEEAKYIASLLPVTAPQILVTSGIHVRRSQLYFAYFGLHPVPVASDFVKAKPFMLADGDYNLFLTDAAIHEYLGIARFHLYNALGLNRRPRPATAAP